VSWPWRHWASPHRAQSLPRRLLPQSSVTPTGYVQTQYELVDDTEHTRDRVFFRRLYGGVRGARLHATYLQLQFPF
jgi:hypothetical protein